MKVSLCAADVSALVSAPAMLSTPQLVRSGMDAPQDLRDASLD
jgi:hypothetical protein